MVPGTASSVVNSYAPVSEISCPVNLFNNVDFPTDGKPTNATLLSPDFLTSYPSLLPPPPPMILSCCSLFNLANFAFNFPT